MQSLDKKKLKAAADYLDSWLESNFAHDRIPGLQVAVWHDNNLLLSKALGYANLAQKEKLTTKHTFRIASHSKTYTATAIMQLREAGKLGLDDYMSKHLEWFKSSKDPRVGKVTIRQLMNHTAGLIRDGEDSDYWQLLRNFPKAPELKEYIKNSKLFYDSDERWKYSNYGYGYLGLLIEALSGLSYSDYADKYIIDKLGLKFTGADIDDRARKSLATGYSLELFGKPRRPYKHAQTYAMMSATGFYANAEDLCRYFSAHFLGDQRLLSDETKRSMQHGYWDTEENNEKYGLGFNGYPTPGWDLKGHGGGFPGFITNTEFDAERKLVVTALTNSSDGPAGRITAALINLIDYFQKQGAPKPNSSKKKFAGRFYSTWGPTDVVLAGDKLIATDTSWWVDFKHCDELSVVDKATLKIEKARGSYFPGEFIRYKFNSRGEASQISFGGRTMLPYTAAKRKDWI